MRADTKRRKNATQMLRATQEQEWWADQVVHVMLEGKRALDAAMLDVGRLVAETLMYMERGREIWARLPSYVVRASQMGESTWVDLCR